MWVIRGSLFFPLFLYKGEIFRVHALSKQSAIKRSSPPECVNWFQEVHELIQKHGFCTKIENRDGFSLIYPKTLKKNLQNQRRRKPIISFLPEKKRIRLPHFKNSSSFISKERKRNVVFPSCKNRFWTDTQQEREGERKRNRGKMENGNFPEKLKEKNKKRKSWMKWGWGTEACLAGSRKMKMNSKQKHQGRPVIAWFEKKKFSFFLLHRIQHLGFWFLFAASFLHH